MKRKMAHAMRKPRTGYGVGYGRPPLSTRFRPGKSGNPKGRPKGVRNVSSMARDALEKTIDLAENGTHRKMTVRERAYEQLAEKAISGDIKALNFLLALESQERPAGLDQSDDRASAEQALEIVEAFLDRERAAKRERKQ
jgi:hypothetical protein